MKRILLSLIKIFGVLSASLVIFFVLATWLLSYVVIETISTAGQFDLEQPKVFQNEAPFEKSRKNEVQKIEMKSLGQEIAVIFKNLDVLKDIEDADQDLKTGKFPEVCKILCAPAIFNPGEGISSSRPLDNLRNFYFKERGKAFDDPAYRMSLELFVSTISFFSSTSRQFITDFAKILNIHEVLSTNQKIIFSMQLTYNLFKEIFVFKNNFKIGSNRHRINRDLIKLRPQCENTDRLKIVKLCQEIQLKVYPSVWD